MKRVCKKLSLIFTLCVLINFTVVQGLPSNIKSVSNNQVLNEGDLIIEGSETYEIKNTDFTQVGNIIVRDNAKLVLKKSLLHVLQDFAQEFWVYIEDSAQLILVSSDITSDHELRIRGHDYSEINIKKSVIFWANDNSQQLIEVFDESNLFISNSNVNYIGCYDQSTTKIRNTVISDSVYVVGGSCSLQGISAHRVGMAFHNSNTFVELSGLYSGYYHDWSLDDYYSEGLTQSFDIKQSDIGDWYIGLWGSDSVVNIVDSNLRGISVTRNSEVNLVNTPIKHWIQVGEDGIIKVYWPLVVSCYYGVDSIEGALVSVYSHSSLIDEKYSDEYGAVSFVLLDSVITSLGTTTDNEYQVTAFYNSQLLDENVIMDQKREISFQFYP